MTIRLSTNNSKLVKTSGESVKVIGFGIPADRTFGGGNTCPGASACRAVCFAKQGAYNFKNVKEARMANLDASMGPGFVADTVAALRRRRSYNVVRVHDSGDFYSQEYLDRWYAVARAMPERVFYAYTKSMHLDLWGAKPDNFRLVQSLGGKWDKRVDLSKPHSRIFASHEARIQAGYVDGNVSDLPAIEGETRIGLVYHGVRNLTPAQERYFG